MECYAANVQWIPRKSFVLCCVVQASYTSLTSSPERSTVFGELPSCKLRRIRPLLHFCHSSRCLRLCLQEASVRGSCGSCGSCGSSGAQCPLTCQPKYHRIKYQSINISWRDPSGLVTLVVSIWFIRHTMVIWDYLNLYLDLSPGKRSQWKHRALWRLA